MTGTLNLYPFIDPELLDSAELSTPSLFSPKIPAETDLIDALDLPVGTSASSSDNINDSWSFDEPTFDNSSFTTSKGSDFPLLVGNEPDEAIKLSNSTHLPAQQIATRHSARPLLVARVPAESPSSRESKVVQGRKHHCTDASCNWTFISKRDRDRHINSVHNDLKEPCPRCGKLFKPRGDNLKRHMKKHCSRET